MTHMKQYALSFLALTVPMTCTVQPVVQEDTASVMQHPYTKYVIVGGLCLGAAWWFCRPKNPQSSHGSDRKGGRETHGNSVTQGQGGGGVRGGGNHWTSYTDHSAGGQRHQQREANAPRGEHSGAAAGGVDAHQQGPFGMRPGGWGNNTYGAVESPKNRHGQGGSAGGGVGGWGHGTQSSLPEGMLLQSQFPYAAASGSSTGGGR